MNRKNVPNKTDAHVLFFSLNSKLFKGFRAGPKYI